MRFYDCALALEHEPKDEGDRACGPSRPRCLRRGRTIEQVKRGRRAATRRHVAAWRARQGRREL
jgi:hypothetical protein